MGRADAERGDVGRHWDGLSGLEGRVREYATELSAIYGVLHVKSLELQRLMSSKLPGLLNSIACKVLVPHPGPRHSRKHVTPRSRSARARASLSFPSLTLPLPHQLHNLSTPRFEIRLETVFDPDVPYRSTTLISNLPVTFF